ncbi:MAG TPA: sigma-54 dependent transcriptional regulator [Steroidobacteraceae bacterium]|nr:sigma-54 dependent transcriptional regulator [Steroidobacteraceae bacterium]
MPDARILIVDDEPDLVELVVLTLQRMGLAHAAAGTLREARRQLLAASHDLVLCDMRLPDGDGLELLEWLQVRRPGLPCAVITAHGNIETAVRALKLGAFDFLSKPLDLSALRRLIAGALKLGERRSDDATFQGPRLLGSSAPMEQLREMIARVARSQAPVHIAGESGTGKELVARLIHQSGPRAEAPFVAVNCGAIPGELMESEFFGHKRGSFTGAVADKKGLVQSAEGGTLFLDEVADLPLHMQVKLLRVIQEKSVRPVGETAETPVDVRLLSATHRNLAELVARGGFREDLFYRIDVIELRVPSLRERPGDVPELANYILQRLRRRNADGAAAELTAEAVAMLSEYDFPGNVRELENILERALTLSPDGRIRPDDIRLRAAPRHEAAVPQAAQTPETGTEALGDRLDGLEREAILHALEQTHYNRTAAAKLLGVTFRALRYRIKKLGIE